MKFLMLLCWFLNILNIGLFVYLREFFVESKFKVIFLKIKIELIVNFSCVDIE